ncbi:enolase C-terminal domain-like protein [Streptomyces coelicoflavus]|uniref:enolase C-terminal domain-like protein n=1 Tax=Streptomyces coelicoflavus TaxID=285562 RepID=UPI003A85C413
MTQAASSGQVLRGSPAVDDLAVSVYRIPTDLPGGDATLTWEATTLVLVEAVAAGVTGLGFTHGSPATAPVIEHELADLVVGHDAFDAPAANDRMSRALRNAGRPGIAAGAVSAVDTALWDLKARLLGPPLLRLLGAARTEVAVYGSGGLTTYNDDQLVEQLRGWTDQGIDRVKIKVAESWGRQEARGLHRTALARRTVGKTAELYVDANGGYTRKQAIRMAAAMSGLGVTWLEEPVSSDDLTGLREVRDAVTADVAAGEYGYDLPYFARMAASGAVDCLQADVTRCGGITIWLRAAAVAEGLGLHISGHCAPHLHAHVAAAVPNTRHLEWFHDHVRIENMLFHGTLDPRGGTLTPRRLR